MPGATNYRQDRILAAVGPDGAIFRSNGEYAEWDEDALASLEDALALKANAANPVFTGTVTVPDGALAIADTNGLQSALNLKANAANPVLTGTVIISGSAAITAALTVGTTMNFSGTLNHAGGTAGFFGTTPISQPAANADTSGATLPDLEIEVNQIKALLRSLGLMAT
jgi:hypothetical protein